MNTMNTEENVKRAGLLRKNQKNQNAPAVFQRQRLHVLQRGEKLYIKIKKKGSSAGTVALSVIITILILALAAAGAYYYFFVRGDASQSTDQPVQTQQETQQTEQQNTFDEQQEEPAETPSSDTDSVLDGEQIN